MFIKRLTIGDEAKACEISKLFHECHVETPQVAEFLSNPLNFLIAAYIDEKPVGFLIAHELQRFDGKPSKIYLHEIEVQSQHRQKGIGKKLIAELQKLCTSKKIFLITNPTHTEAMTFYPATGASEISRDNVLFEYQND